MPDPAAPSAADESRAENGEPTSRPLNGTAAALRRAVGDRFDGSSGPDSGFRRFCLTGARRRCIPLCCCTGAYNAIFRLLHSDLKLAMKSRALPSSKQTANSDAQGAQMQLQRPQQHLTPSTIASIAASHASTSAEPDMVRQPVTRTKASSCGIGAFVSTAARSGFNSVVHEISTVQEERPQLASRDLQYLRKRKLDMDELLGFEAHEELRAMS